MRSVQTAESRLSDPGLRLYGIGGNDAAVGLVGVILVPFVKVRRRLRVVAVVGWSALVPGVWLSLDPASAWRLPTIIFGVAMVGVSMLQVQVLLLEELVPLLKDWFKAYLLGAHDSAAGPPDPGRRLWSVG